MAKGLQRGQSTLPDESQSLVTSRVALSYVVVTDQYRTIRRVLDALRAQTARDRLELVVVVPQGVELPEIDRREFGGVRIVERASVWPMPHSRAAGARAATAPMIFLGETHSFPAPGFAQAIIDASTLAWDVLVPGIGCANPATAVSYSNYLMDYGTWSPTLPGGEIPIGPTWNVVYRRDVLLGFGEQLDRLLSHSDEMPVAVRAAGLRTRFAPAAVITHANVNKARWWFEQRYLAGLLVGGSRRQRFRASKRLLYLAASPLIPAILVRRLSRAIAAGRRQGMPRLTIPALLAGTVFRSFGEMVAYLRGASPTSQDRMDEFELHKLEYTELSY